MSEGNDSSGEGFRPEMSNPFFEHPILNSPHAYPPSHWELDKDGQPTQKIIETRRRADFITPIPKPRKRKTPAQQEEIVFDEGKALSTRQQQPHLYYQRSSPARGPMAQLAPSIPVAGGRVIS